MVNNQSEMHLKFLQKAIQRREKATGEFIGNETAKKITKSLHNWLQNTSETVEIETKLPNRKVLTNKH